MNNGKQPEGEEHGTGNAANTQIDYAADGDAKPGEYG
jgi:hypothetical protein